jgi:hypothetical protein
MKTPIVTAAGSAMYSRNHTKNAFALISLIALFAFASCSNDPIFSAIQNEVKLKDPSIVGTVYAMEAIDGDLYATNGYIYKRTAGVGEWNKIALPTGAARCYKLASDGTNLYGLFTKSDWKTFHSVQLYSAGTWTPLTGLDSVDQIGSGNGRIYAFVENAGGSTQHIYDAYISTGAGATTFNPSPVIKAIGVPMGSAGDYFVTKTTVYQLSGTNATSIGTPGSGLCGIVVGANGNVYTANYGYAFRWDGTSWTSCWLDLENDPATGLTILQSASKHLLIIGCDEGYGEVTLDASTGALGSYISPGSTSLSTTDTDDEDQYNSSIGLYNVSGIFAFTSPVPAADQYVLYVSINHYKYDGLWSYYDTTQSEWNRE